MKDGLSHSTVFRAFEDHKGFIWFSTSYGVSRFNGRNFENISSEDGLRQNIVLSVSEDKEGRKYACTYGGGVNIITDTSVSKWEFKNGEGPGDVSYLLHDGSVKWLLSLDRVRHIYRIKNDSITQMNVRSHDGEELRVNKFSTTSYGILLATGDGVYKLDNSSIQPFITDVINYEEVFDLSEGANGDLYIGLKNEVLHIRDSKVLHRYKFEDKAEMSDMLFDSENRLWISLANGGVFLLDDGQLLEMSTRLGLKNIIVHDIFQDSEGNFWFSTRANGVFFLNNTHVTFYPPESGVNLFCRSIVPIPGNRLLVASEGKTSIWQDGKARDLPVKNLNGIELIYQVFADENELYICTPYKLILKDLRSAQREKVIPYKGQQTGVVSILKDSRGRIWAGSFSKLYTVEDGKLEDVKGPAFLDEKRYFHIYEDKDGCIWFATNRGLIKYAGDTFSAFNLSEEYLDNIIFKLRQDSRGRMWFATSNGLVVKDGDRYRRYSVKNGLLHNICRTITEDSTGTLWVGTLGGLNYIDVQTLSISEFKTDIFPDDVMALHFGPDKKLFAGSMKGLSVIDTRGRSNTPKAPRIYITKVVTSGKTYMFPASVDIPYKNKKLVIEFIALSYYYSDKVDYRYKIDEIDTAWHYTKNTSLELPSLSGGEFHLILSARQNKGQWSAPINLNVNIEIPFWKNKALQGFAILLVLIGVYLITRSVTHRQAKKQKGQLVLYNKMAYLKQQALTALINPHFIFNCMNSIQHYLNRKDFEAASSYLADFATLIRLTMENAQHAFITISNELQRIKLYLSLEQLRIGEELQYEIIVEPGIDVPSVKIPNMVLQPYIENAIWHGVMPLEHGGKVSIAFQKNGDREIKISINDNGVGIQEAASTLRNDRESHLGIKITEERLALLRDLLQREYSVHIQSPAPGSSSGTLVEVLVPIVNDEQELEQFEKEIKNNK